MSQHTVTVKYNEKNVEVLMGWDAPLQRYFMVIEEPFDDTPFDENADVEFDDEDFDGIDQPIYSNLNDEKLVENPSLSKSITYFANKLKEFNIIVPQEMIEAVVEDGINNVGNKDVTYTV